MKVELLLIIFIGLMFLAWSVWYRWSTRRLLKKYNPNGDRSKYGKEKRIFGRGEPSSKKSIVSDAGHTKLAEQDLLETATINPVGEDSRKSGVFKDLFKR